MIPSSIEFPEEEPVNPNVRQVGGQHYKGADFQPWDWPWKHGVGAYEYIGIKYVTRFEDKGGLEDLDKAIHYAEKALFLYRQGNWDNKSTARFKDVLEYSRENNLSSLQVCIIACFAMWSDDDELEKCIELINDLKAIAAADAFTEAVERSTDDEWQRAVDDHAACVALADLQAIAPAPGAAAPPVVGVMGYIPEGTQETKNEILF